MRLLVIALWCVAAFVVTLLVIQPIGAEQQLIFGLFTIAGLIVIRALRLQGFWRHAFFLFGAVLVLRYVYWRTTQTLPSISSPADFIPGIILYGAEMFCVLVLAMNLFVIAQPIDRKPARRLRDDEAPTVDIFVPSYNEDVALLGGTLAAAKAMIYPQDKLTIYLLDDGGTDEKVNSHDPAVSAAAIARRANLQALSAELGVTYITRERNVSAKAGNLSNGLAHSSGELIAVFDADHAPAKDFLLETVGFFTEDEKLFLVQTPHFFLNPDPVEKNLSTFARMPSENEMFYGLIQKGLDKWNAAFFCGSAAVLRRAALEEVGGFSGTSITEDCETALEIHSRGWNSLYVDKPLIAGLQPESFASFIGQRSRWCRGMIQILLMKNPMIQPGLTMAQRICYSASSMFWLFPIPRIVFLIAPLLYIFLDLKFFNATVQDFVAYTVIYMIAATIMQNYSYGRFRWPWVSELYEYVQSIYLLPAIISVIRNPRRPTFNVTAKGQKTEEDYLSNLAWPYFVVFAILLAGLFATIYRLNATPEDAGLLLIVGFWNAFNLIIAGVALGTVAEKRERRTTQRLPVKRRAMLHFDDQSIPVAIEDVSLGGALVTLLAPAKATGSSKRAATLAIDNADGIGLRSIAVKVANGRVEGDGRVLGLSFGELSSGDYRELASLMYGDLKPLQRIRLARQKSRGVIWGTLQMAFWSVRHALRGLYFAGFRRHSAAPRSVRL